jgi:ABC-type sugar transport system substrate-binding protein
MHRFAPQITPSGTRMRRTAIALAGAIAITVLSACAPAATPPASSDSPAQSVRLGFSPLSLDIPAMSELADGLTKAGASAGVAVTVSDPKFDVPTQVRQIEQWIQLGQVDAIWVIPVAPQALVPIVAEAQKAGVVLLIDSNPQEMGFDGPQPGVSFASTDLAGFGGKTADLVSKCADERLNGAAKIIYLKDGSGQVAGAETDDAIQGALAKESPDSKVVATISPADQLTAQQQTLSALQGAQDANAAIATNDESALGALAAFQQAGKDPKDVCIVGGGTGEQGIAAINAGTIYGGVAFDFRTDTGLNIAEIHRLAADPKGTGKTIVVPINVVLPK